MGEDLQSVGKSKYDEYSKSIHSDWSNLYKAMYVYARMITENSVERDSKELAKAFKEMMDKFDIGCRYVENADGTHAWNEILIDGEYYPVDLSMDIQNSREEGPGAIMVHNFGKNKNFYEYPEHQMAQKPTELKLLDRDVVQKALNTVVDQIATDQTWKYETVRENIRIPIKSKELQGVFSADEVSLDSLKGEQRPIVLSLTDNKTEEMLSELKTIGIYYPEVLNHIEIVNKSDAPVNVQEVVDGIYEAKSVGSDVVVDPVSITIASSFAEDFDVDLSKIPEVAENVTKRTNDAPMMQGITFRNTDSSKSMRVPAFKSKVSDNLGAMAFEGFDVEGLDLTGTKVTSLSFNGVTNIDKVTPARDVSYDVAITATDASEVTSALSNFTIHDLTINSVNLRDRAILQELATNPELVCLTIHNSYVNNIDGLEDFDGRLYSLDLQGNDLDVDDIERIQDFQERNPLLECYLSRNMPYLLSIDNATEISDETHNLIRELNTRKADGFKVRTKSSAVDYLLWNRNNIPYYIKDAETIREELGIRLNPMMVENDNELETFDFTQSHLSGGTLLLTPAQVEHLIAIGKSVPQNVRLLLDSTAELSSSQATDLASRANALGINIVGVQIIDKAGHNNKNQMTPYTLSEYVYIRDTLDLIVEGIDLTEPDIDKFAVVYQRLRDSITYDYEAIKEGNATEARYYAEKMNTSRNLLQGLEEGQCVCSGYADILRNALLMVGINTENVTGFTGRDSSGKLTGAHAWNRVELDDGTGTKKWYHTDLTWCAGMDDRHLENYTLKGESSNIFTSRHITRSVGLPTATTEEFDRTLFREAFNRAKTRSFNIKDRKTEISIPTDPVLNIEILDRDRVLAEYTRRKNDMCAKYYGDREYRDEYMERSRRFRSHEVERNPGTVAAYRTVENYPEREEDEQFLLLDKYAECLERMTKYENGDTSVYTGDSAAVQKALEKDREYVETRNHTFDKTKDMRNNLATLGKFGERVPYIPRQDGIVKNVGRVVMNAGIAARNLVAPVYRGIGRFVAVPVHRLVVGDRESSPFRNNWYHRMVARRDYFTEQNNTNTPGHPIRNGLKARVQAIVNSKEGNKAVLNAGAFEIQSNIVAQERERNMIHSLSTQSSEFEAQITALQNAISANPVAPNIDDARNALQEKINKKSAIDSRIAMLANNRTGISQTDAISDAQHDIAVKEEVTLKTTVIKGFAKGLTVRYVGPKIHDWLASKGAKTVTETSTIKVPTQKRRWVEPEYKTEAVPVYEETFDPSRSMSDMMSANGGKSVTGFYSVYGGERGGASYTLTGNENITAIFQVNGKGGTGFSDIVGLKAPTLVDKTFDSSLLTPDGLLNQNLTISDLVSVVNGPNADLSNLADMYVSIGDQYWVRLSDLTSDLVSKVQTGTELKRVLETAGHFETYTDYVEKVVEASHTVANDIFARAHDIALGVGVGADGAIDVAENLRFSSTDVRNNKAMPRNYGFSGDADIPTSRKEYKDQRER